MRIFFKLMVISIVIFICSCSSTIPVQTQPIITQESLLVKCSQDTPLPENFVLDKDGNKVYNGKEIMRVLIEYDKMYGECSSIHNQLVDTIRNLNSTKQINKN